MSLFEKESQAKEMLRNRKQPRIVAQVTGLSLEWIELQARKMRKRPMMKGVANGI